MVWIHGGAYSSGSAMETQAQDGENLARFGDVVVVTVDHRLNVFGFLDTLHLTVSIETVRKALLKLGYRRKKKAFHASEQERTRCGGEAESMERHYLRVQRK